MKVQEHEMRIWDAGVSPFRDGERCVCFILHTVAYEVPFAVAYGYQVRTEYGISTVPVLIPLPVGRSEGA
jgi:hypothetical protein